MSRARADEGFEEKVARVLAEPIELAPYESEWPRRFADEATKLRRLFPELLGPRIEHVGSTSVPGLLAKPVVDMLVEVLSLSEAREIMVPALEALGYDHFWRPSLTEDGEPHYCWFIGRDADGVRTHHLHVIEGGPEFSDHWDCIYFRDHLRANAGAAQEYACLKQRLAAEHRGDREAYTEAKGQFIRELTEWAKSAASPA